MNIDSYLTTILIHEGGYVNHPNDRGGPTNFGITQATLSNYLGRKASINDVKELKEETAREIYLSRYFYSPRINMFPEPIQLISFDMCVNHGPRNAIRMVQRVINQASVINQRISEDGIAGVQTFNAAEVTERSMGNYFTNAIVDERINFYELIVSRRPDQRVFLAGWKRRANSFRVAV